MAGLTEPRPLPEPSYSDTDRLELEKCAVYAAFEYWLHCRSGLEGRLRWDPRERQFFLWQGQFWAAVPEEMITACIAGCADALNLRTTPGDFTVTLRRLKGLPGVLFLGEWDPPGLENTLDGVLDLNTLKILPAEPELSFRYVVPRHLPVSEPWAEQIFETLLGACARPHEVRQFLANIAKRDFSEKLFLICYGRAGAGKSTLLNIPANLYGDGLTGAADLFQLGRRFGMAEIFGKKINVDGDMPTKVMTAAVVSQIKKLTGGVRGSDNQVHVEMKGRDPFSVRLECAFLFGCNQLPRWEDDALSEVESVGRRALLAHYPRPAVPCPGLEEITLEPEFLDQVYSYLIRIPRGPVFPGPREERVKATLDEWMADCDPLQGILKGLYKYSEDGTDCVPCSEAVQKARAELEDAGLAVPKNLAAQVTQGLALLGIVKNTTKIRPKYLHVKRCYTEEAPPADLGRWGGP